MSLLEMAKAETKKPGSRPVPPPAPAPKPAPEPELYDEDTAPWPDAARAVAPEGAAKVEQIEVDAVVCGCLMKLTMTAVGPAGVLPFLRGIDPACKVREDFPAKNFGGKRETQRARLMVITLRSSDSGLFIDLVCKGETEVSVGVPKKKSPEFLGMLAATGRVSEDHLVKLEAAVSAKGQATVILDGEEAVDVEYWTTEDGKTFLEALHGATLEGA